MKIPVVYYSIGVETPIFPSEPLPELPEIPRGSMVVVEGRAPIWRYGLAFHKLHGSPAAAVAVYDPRMGAVVVASHLPGLLDGTVLNLSLGQTEVEGCPPPLTNDGRKFTIE